LKTEISKEKEKDLSASLTKKKLKKWRNLEVRKERLRFPGSVVRRR